MEEINGLIGLAKEKKAILDTAKKAYEKSIMATGFELEELEIEIENRLLALGDTGVNAYVCRRGTAGWSQSHVVTTPERIADLSSECFELFGQLMKLHPATFQIKVLPGAYAKLVAKEPEIGETMVSLGFRLEKTNKFYIK